MFCFLVACGNLLTLLHYVMFDGFNKISNVLMFHYHTTAAAAAECGGYIKDINNNNKREASNPLKKIKHYHSQILPLFIA